MNENAIVFRGRRLRDSHGNPWAEGFYYEFKKKAYILYEDAEGFDCEAPVDPETIGQYSGLLDENSIRIFEGDIVEFESHGYCDSKERGVVIFKDGCYGIAYIAHWDVEHGFDDIKLHRIGKKDKWQDMGASGEITYTYEVLGNVYDNSDLLGKAYDLMMGTDESEIEEDEE